MSDNNSQVSTRRRRKLARPPLQFFDERLRYPIPLAAQLRGESTSKLWRQIREGKVKVIRDGGNTYVPGSECVAKVVEA